MTFIKSLEKKDLEKFTESLMKTVEKLTQENEDLKLKVAHLEELLKFEAMILEKNDEE